ncbi:hypothetical protein HMI51_33915 [Corallococcus coralloides]|nr:hypothetical protein [Corallococcus coralloides]
MVNRNRAATENLTEGIGKARWDDDEAALRELFPEAMIRSLPGIGTHLSIPNVVEGAGGVPVGSYFFLGPQGIKYFVLGEEFDDENKVDVRPCIHSLAHRFGFGPISASRKDEWLVHRVQVMLQLTDLDERGVPFGFKLRVNRPGGIQTDFRIFEGFLFPPRKDPREARPPPPAWDHPELTALIRPDRYVVCPFCGKAFSLADKDRWNGSRHLSCGQRLQLKQGQGS